VLVSGLGSSAITAFWGGGLGQRYSTAAFLVTTFVGAMVGALILSWFISSVGYEISMTAAVGALFVGRAVGTVLPLLLIKTAVRDNPGGSARYLPVIGTGFGYALGLLGLMVSAWLVKTFARRGSEGVSVAAVLSGAAAIAFPQTPHAGPAPQAAPGQYEQLLFLVRTSVDDVRQAAVGSGGGPLDLGARGLPLLASLTGRLDHTRPPEPALQAHTMLAGGLRELQDYLRALQEEPTSPDRDRAKRLQEKKRSFETVDRAFKQLAKLDIHPHP
jgi:hypothetical protein